MSPFSCSVCSGGLRRISFFKRLFTRLCSEFSRLDVERGTAENICEKICTGSRTVRNTDVETHMKSCFHRGSRPRLRCAPTSRLIQLSSENTAAHYLEDSLYPTTSTQINTFIHQGCIQLIKSEDVYNQCWG